METPPPYSPPPRPKGKNTVWIVLGAVGVLVCCGGPILLVGGGYWLISKNKDMIECTVNMAVIHDAMEGYVRKIGTYPPAASWQSAVKPFVTEDGDDKGARKAIGLGQLNFDDAIPCSTGDVKSMLAYNSAIAGKKAADVKDSEVLIFETTAADAKPNLSGTFKERGTAGSPTIMGTPRGWFRMTVDGDVKGVKNQGALKIESK